MKIAPLNPPPENVYFIYVYVRCGFAKVLTHEQAQQAHRSMIADGWAHTATLGAAAYIEHLIAANRDECIKSVRSITEV